MDERSADATPNIFRAHLMIKPCEGKSFLVVESPHDRAIEGRRWAFSSMSDLLGWLQRQGEAFEDANP
jgi:hypothetical protein